MGEGVWRAAVDRVVAVLCEQIVVAVAAREGVVPFLPEQPVVAVHAGKGSVGPLAGDDAGEDISGAIPYRLKSETDSLSTFTAEDLGRSEDRGGEGPRTGVARSAIARRGGLR